MPTRPGSPGGNCTHAWTCVDSAALGTATAWLTYCAEVVAIVPGANVNGHTHASELARSGVFPDGSTARLAFEMPADGNAGVAVRKSMTATANVTTPFTVAGGAP